jgi:hypothetical protein
LNKEHETNTTANENSTATSHPLVIEAVNDSTTQELWSQYSTVELQRQQSEADLLKQRMISNLKMADS